jgi:hypothetical protein
MVMEPFIRHFPDLGKTELRSVHLLGEPGPDSIVPPGDYALMECYCTDPACDCRRVILNVIEKERGHVATISFGFDRDADMAGPFLDPLNVQSPYAQELMEMIEQMTLHDPEYLARLERHYHMVKEKLAPRTGPTPKARAEKRRKERRKHGRHK